MFVRALQAELLSVLGYRLCVCNQSACVVLNRADAVDRRFIGKTVPPYLVYT